MSRVLTVLAIALLATPAWAADIDSIAGTYQGKVVDVSGAPGAKDEACEVIIEPKPNSVRFQVGGAVPFLVENDVVEQGLASGKKKVKLSTRGRGGAAAFVVLRFRGGNLHFVRVKAAGHLQKFTLACGKLTAR